MSFRRVCLVIGLVVSLALTGCIDHLPPSKAPASTANSASSSTSAGAQTYAAKINNVVKKDAHGRIVNSLAAPSNQTYYFAFDNSRIRSIDQRALQVQAMYLVKHDNVKIVLYGNTDNRGSREYNVGLGSSRDDSVAQFLMSYGVSRSQIEEVSYGEQRPAALGNDERDWALNRRVELNYKV